MFKVQSVLISHERVHNGDRPYVCVHPGCQWSFRTSSKLRRHERSHKNDRRYICQYCPSKSYIRPEHLREHVEIVHKNHKLACPFADCQARFTQRPSLIAHVKKHQVDPMSLDLSRYRCVIEKCGQKFQSKRNLTQHVNKQHQPELHAANINEGSNETSDQSELDLMALLSCVAAEMEQQTGNEKPEPELITVDASAITPIKSEPLTPNIISKSRKRKQPPIFKISKKEKSPSIEDNSTINMQDLV